MFDLAWAEIAIVGLVAVLVLGPKELPHAMRTMSKIMRKMRSLTSELQGHMNEIVREAELDEVRQSIQKLSSANLKAKVTQMVDPTGELIAELNQPLLPQGSATNPSPDEPRVEAPRMEGPRVEDEGAAMLPSDPPPVAEPSEQPVPATPGPSTSGPSAAST